MVEKENPIRTLRQSYGWWRKQELVLYEGEIRLVYRSGPNRSARAVQLEWIDTNESQARIYPHWARRTFVVSILGLGAAIAVGLEWSILGWITAVIFAASALVSGVFHQLGAYDATYLYSTFTGEFLFAVRSDRPDPETVKAFVKEVKDLAEGRREKIKMESEMPTIATEIHHLARLREKEIITEDEFKEKKRELISDLLSE